MEIERASVGEVEIFRVTGRLDSATSPGLEAQVLSAVRPGANRVVMDLTRVDYVSSSGLRVILLAAKQARATQGGFAIFGMSDPIQHVFKMSGFARIIPVFAEEAQAVAAASGP